MKEIHGFPGYFVCENGEVHSPRKKLRQTPNARGYLRVFLCRADGTHTRYVHRLVCVAFNGLGEGDVRHLNGDPGDNRASNLAWGTRRQNMQDSRDHGRIMQGVKAKNAILNDEIVIAMRDEVRAGASMQEVANRYGLSDRMVANAASGRRWAHIPGALGACYTRRKLTEQQVREARALWPLLTQRQIAEKFGVTRNAVYQIVNRISYAHID